MSTYPLRSLSRRVEESAHVEERTIIDATGNKHTISRFAQGGAIGISVPTETGDRTFVELPYVRTHRNPNKTGYRSHTAR